MAIMEVMKRERENKGNYIGPNLILTTSMIEGADPTAIREICECDSMVA